MTYKDTKIKIKLLDYINTDDGFGKENNHNKNAKENESERKREKHQ